MNVQSPSSTSWDKRWLLLAAIGCVCFGLALIADVQQEGDGVWYWYAALLHNGTHLYADLKLPLQPLMVLETELFLVLLGKSWIASKVPAVLNLLLYVLAMYLIIAKARWPEAQKALVLAAAFFVGIGFEDYRFDDYHVVASSLILYCILLFLSLREGEITPRRQYAIVAGLGFLIGLLFTTRVAEGAALFMISMIVIPAFSSSGKRSSLVILPFAFAATVAAVVAMTGDTLGAWASSSIFRVASIKGGGGAFITDPFRMLWSAIVYVVSQYGLHCVYGAAAIAVSLAVLATFRSGVMSAAESADFDGGIGYLADAGALVAIIMLVTWFQSARIYPFHGPSFVQQWLAVGVYALLYSVCVSSAHVRTACGKLARGQLNMARVLFAVVSLVAAFSLAAPYVFVLGVVQFLIVYRLANDKTHYLGWYVAVFAASVMAWAFSLGLPFTPFSLELLSATPSNGLALFAFGVSFAFVWFNLFVVSAREESFSRMRRVFEYAVAAVLFGWQALRIDGLLADWVPYHRSYWSGPATFLRHGHWLLWDVPSQYGFLSEIVIAIAPGGTTHESLYIVIALALVAQALLLFAILRSYGNGIVNLIFSFALTSAVFFSSGAGRYPFGGRLYPQLGLRFLWVEALLFVAFLMYRQSSRRAMLRVVGFLVWAAAIAWSFESAVWSTVVWAGFLFAEFAITSGKERNPQIFLKRFCPFIVIPIVLMSAVELYYRHFLGHGPDWTGYIEFSQIYSTDSSFAQPVNPVGGGWILLLCLTAFMTIFSALVARRQFDAIPIVVAAWLAMWVVASYYVVEAFDDHVNALVGIMGYVGALAGVVYARERLNGSTSATLAVAGFVPFIVVLLTTSFGHFDPSVISPQYVRNIADYTKPIDGELLGLMQRAGITSKEKVLLPQSVTWSTLAAGVVMPFLREGARENELVAWLPVSPNGPYGTWYTLNKVRRETYIDRFVSMERGGGWLVTYAQPADCNAYSTHRFFRTVRKLSSRNYSAALCLLRESSHE